MHPKWSLQGGRGGTERPTTALVYSRVQEMHGKTQNKHNTKTQKQAQHKYKYIQTKVIKTKQEEKKDTYTQTL